MEKTAKPMPIKKTFTDYLRLWFKWFLDPLGGFFNRLGITPNMMTMLGLLGNTVGAYYLARGEMLTGGLFVLLMTPIDALDGTMARLPVALDCRLDQVVDRYGAAVRAPIPPRRVQEGRCREIVLEGDRADCMALPIVVLDDGWLSLIQVKQERRNFAVYGTDVTRGTIPDPPAHYFGVPVVDARTPDALRTALRAALRAEGPTIVETRIDPAHYLDTVYD